MRRHVIRRMIQAAVVLLGVSILLFALIYLIPGDPVRLLSGGRHLSETAADNLRQRLHLDQPLHIQYGYFLSDLARGDLGESYRYHRPVTAILRDFFPNSIRLAVAAVAVEAVVGIAAGIWAALRRRSAADAVLTIGTSLLMSIPVFWLGMILQLIFGVKLRWLPVSGLGDGGLRFYILPALTLAALYIALVAQTTRAGMRRVLDENYILTARSAGISERKIVWKYALKNAMAPVVTLLGLDLGALMGGSIAVEVVYNWPGIGNQIYQAILARDRPLVIGAVLVMVVIFVAVNLLVDLAQMYFDPRTRERELGEV